ncbi:MAG: hypothetical protein RL462_801 [Pseudomonadota bacterium]|jgi:hypothetical protein
MKLSNNAKSLEAAVIVALAEQNLPTEAAIFDLAVLLRNIPHFKVTDEEFDFVIKKLHQLLRVDMGLGSKVVNENKPWLLNRKSSIDPFYWTRYKRSLLKDGWSPKVVGALDEVTDDILDLSGNPVSETGWPIRGLVMGDVQSGKTSNYTGLICKAADAGYRLIVLLTGTLESLRRQTQERLDSGFVGLDSSGIVNQTRLSREIGVGLLDGRRAAGVFTSTLVDFKVSTVNQLGFRLDAFNEPVLLVVKKNPRILANLTAWLRSSNANSNGQIDLPLMLIDDEADNASINTAPDRITTINAGIRNLLTIFPRSTYIGFTATPFANVFIHPDSRDEMLNDDLFPRDFVYSLDPPSNYFGAVKIFGDDSVVDCIRSIEDAGTIFPPSHRATLEVDELPNTLLEAINAFLLTNAIMDLRGQGPKHRSMLINVSHFTAVQNQVKARVSERVRRIQEDVQNYAAQSTDVALRILTISQLLKTFESEFSNCEFSWEQIQRNLNNSILPIDVRAVNRDTGSASLSYAEYAKDGLRVIAVGGNSLARGLTLEGLCTSYFYRTTAMYDALLQMGRWFGYRSDYEDLVRIWMSPSTANWYSHITEASEELRRDIRYMQNSGLKPRDFGMKVRAHPDSLLITARNKMRHAASITRVMSISEEGLETPRLLSDESAINHNYIQISNLVNKLDSDGIKKSESSKNPLWISVDKQYVVDLLRGFQVHPLNVSFHPGDLATFIETSTDKKLQLWDIVIPNGSRETHSITSSTNVQLQKRKLEVNLERRYLLINERKMRVGSRGVEKEGLSPLEIQAAEESFRSDPENNGSTSVPDWAYRKVRTKPLLILHLLEGSYTNQFGLEETYKTSAGVVLSAVGLSFCKLQNSSQRVRYQINLVEVRNLIPEVNLEDLVDDEEEMEDVNNAEY